MPSTYSVNLGTQFETYRKPDIVSVLRDLPDNTSKLISPRDVRDAFLTTWASSPIKQTRNTAGDEYIGIDSGNPSDRDIKQRILLGKRGYGNDEVMSESLLNSTDADIFIYNTKLDSESQNVTRMAFLAGTISSLYPTAPYIEAYYDTTKIDLNIRNQQVNGGINLLSSTGNVVINGIKFPKVIDNSSATNGKILRYVGNYPNGYLKWDDSNVAISQLGSSDVVTNIYGGTVSLNGYELEFVHDEITPIPVGGVPAGTSFSATSFNGRKWPMSEVIRKILYPKVPPTITVSAINQATGLPYAELGLTSSITFDWSLSIFPRNSGEYVTDYYIKSRTGAVDTPANPTLAVSGRNFGLSFSGSPGTTFTGSVKGLVAGSYSSPTFSFYTFFVSDVPGFTASSFPAGFSYSATASIAHTYPIYYGFSNQTFNNSVGNNFTNVVSSLNKYIVPYPGLSGSYTIDVPGGSGYFYFIHQSSTFTSPISKVYDGNGFLIHDSANVGFSFFSAASRTGNLGYSGKANVGVNTQWKAYVSSATCSLAGTNKFTFKF